jgi:Zn-dependent protease
LYFSGETYKPLYAFSMKKSEHPNMNCQKCGQDTLMPFQCPYCGGQYCTQHRLPENHSCPRIGLAHVQKQETVAEALAPNRNSYEFSISFGQPIQNKRHIYMSPKELKHLLPAALLIVAIGFSIVFYNNLFNSNYFTNLGWGLTEISVFAVLLTASFLTHEMAHKITAQRCGLWAEFRLTTWGFVLTLISVFTPFRLISPGAVMISGPAKRDDIGKISIAGPIINIAFSLAALSAAYITTSLSYIVVFLWIASFNAFIAVFNLIPFGILDGLKIYNWNKAVWVIAFAASAVLTIYTYFLA